MRLGYTITQENDLSREGKNMDTNNVSYNYRIEHDSIGDKKVPANAYYGVQSLRAMENFNITGHAVHREMIISIAKIKKGAAMTNYKTGRIDKRRADAIALACDEIIDGKLHSEFIVDAIQGGAGTSLNMNANEVIANRAIELLGGNLGDYRIIHPNDHVNFSQSTNDVYPSCGKLAALALLTKTQNELVRLKGTILKKADEFKDIIKMGRTQLQDAVPILLGQEFYAYAGAILRDIERMEKAKDGLRILNMGGTAVGTGINADTEYCKNIVKEIADVCNEPLRQADDMIDATQNLDVFVNVSGIVKTSAVNLSKMCNDLRLLSSGPRTGLYEINLPAKQNGSSIMPGKVNPVIPEAVNQVAFNIIGNDAAITMACEAGQLELNAFEPVIFYNLFESIETLGQAAATLNNNCIVGITANRDRCKAYVDNSIGIITALCPHIGYQHAADIAKEALKTGKSVRTLITEQNILSPDKLDTVLNPENMTKPGIPGI